MGKKLVIALGGNALGHSPEEQKTAVLAAVSQIVDLVRDGFKIVLVHGNGPQVGLINLAFELADKVDSHVPTMPFAECCAMSQGYIGFHMQNALQNTFQQRGIAVNVTTVITQVIVDPQDPAFQNPTKPVGLFYSEADAKRIMLERGSMFVEDSGRGYRRVVPSPEPIDIQEKVIIQSLMDDGDIVIACGGGGIPVSVEGDQLRSIDAVIDKDKAAAKLALLIDADKLVILTTVPGAALDYGQPNQTWLNRITVNDAQRYISEDHFAPGSMLPKIQAAIEFAKSGPGRETIITDLENVYRSVTKNQGTTIYDDGLINNFSADG